MIFWCIENLIKNVTFYTNSNVILASYLYLWNLKQNNLSTRYYNLVVKFTKYIHTVCPCMRLTLNIQQLQILSDRKYKTIIFTANIARYIPTNIYVVFFFCNNIFFKYIFWLIPLIIFYKFYNKIFVLFFSMFVAIFFRTCIMILFVYCIYKKFIVNLLKLVNIFHAFDVIKVNLLIS